MSVTAYLERQWSAQLAHTLATVDKQSRSKPAANSAVDDQGPLLEQPENRPTNISRAALKPAKNSRLNIARKPAEGVNDQTNRQIRQAQQTKPETSRSRETATSNISAELLERGVEKQGIAQPETDKPEADKQQIRLKQTPDTELSSPRPDTSQEVNTMQPQRRPLAEKPDHLPRMPLIRTGNNIIEEKRTANDTSHRALQPPVTRAPANTIPGRRVVAGGANTARSGGRRRKTQPFGRGRFNLSRYLDERSIFQIIGDVLKVLVIVACVGVVLFEML